MVEMNKHPAQHLSCQRRCVDLASPRLKALLIGASTLTRCASRRESTRPSNLPLLMSLNLSKV
jgi:hypothetical protein